MPNKGPPLARRIAHFQLNSVLRLTNVRSSCTFTYSSFRSAMLDIPLCVCPGVGIWRCPELKACGRVVQDLNQRIGVRGTNRSKAEALAIGGKVVGRHDDDL